MTWKFNGRRSLFLGLPGFDECRFNGHHFWIRLQCDSLAQSRCRFDCTQKGLYHVTSTISDRGARITIFNSWLEGSRRRQQEQQQYRTNNAPQSSPKDWKLILIALASTSSIFAIQPDKTPLIPALCMRRWLGQEAPLKFNPQ